MANRVNAEEVKEILETELGEPAIEAFITAANLTVTDQLGDSTALSAAQLKEIERWLAAHFIACTREPQIVKENTGQAGATYAGKTDMGLDATFYGQQVKILDTTGTLASLESMLSLRDVSMYAIPSFDD